MQFAMWFLSPNGCSHAVVFFVCRGVALLVQLLRAVGAQ